MIRRLPISTLFPYTTLFRSDYTTLDDELIRAAAGLRPELMLKLSRPGFKVVLYDTLEDFYLAEALEYVNAWRQSTRSEEHTSELQSLRHLVCRLLLEKKKKE